MPVHGAVLDPTAISPTGRPSVPADTAGRHRGAESIGVRIGRTFDLVAKVGTFVSLAALLVVAGAAAGLADGVPNDGIPTMTVTFDNHGH